MSDPKVEDAPPEQPVTSQDETTKDAPAVTVEDGDVKTDIKDTKMNGAEKKEMNGLRTYEDGVLKTSAREDATDRNKNSKYDPSILPETDDARLIRNQVCFKNR